MRWFLASFALAACAPAVTTAPPRPAAAPSAAAAAPAFPDEEDVAIARDSGDDIRHAARVVVVDPGAEPRRALRFGDHAQLALVFALSENGGPAYGNQDVPALAMAIPYPHGHDVMAFAISSPDGSNELEAFLSPRGQPLRYLKVEGDVFRMLRFGIEDALVPLPSEPVGVGARWQVRRVSEVANYCAIEERTYRLAAIRDSQVVIDGTLRRLAVDTATCSPRVNQADPHVREALARAHGQPLDTIAHAPDVHDQATIHAELDLAAPLAGETTIDGDSTAGAEHATYRLRFRGTLAPPDAQPR
jgi:hypothetical protein